MRESGSDEWAALVRRQDNVVSRRQALSFYQSNTIDRRVAAGWWTLAYRGVLVLHNGPLSASQRLWAASLAAGNGRPSLLGGLSALLLLGLRNFASDTIHVLVPATRKDTNTPAGIRVHRTTVLGAEDVDATVRPPITNAGRSMVDAAQWARTDREARTIVALCFQQRLVRADQAETALGRLRNAKRRGLVRSTVADVATGSESIGELDFIELCRDYGPPEPSRQVRREYDGRVRYLDAYFDPWRVVVEIDGAHHMYADVWWNDMSRHNVLSINGERLLRFPAFLIRERPDLVAAVVLRALRKAGWPG